jgi:hypothetical protein
VPQLQGLPEWVAVAGLVSEISIPPMIRRDEADALRKI